MTTLLLALSLAVDAFAVSVASSLSAPGFRKAHIAWLAFYFGTFQMGMTLLGAFLGSHFSDLVGELGRWIAFVILAAIGGQMAWSALRGSGQEVCHHLTHGRMLVLALATSIDALAAGVSLGLQHASIFFASIVIGLTAAGLSALGGLGGARVGQGLQTRAALLGGLTLIALGVWNLFG